MHHVYKNANKFHRVDKMQQTFAKPRRGLAQNYYQEVKKGKRKRVIRIIQIIILILLLQSIFQLPQLQLNKIEIEGLTNTPANGIKNEIQTVLNQKKWLIFKNSNYFLFSSGDLTERLATEYFLEDAYLDKSFPHTIKFGGKEKISPFVRQTPDAYYRLSYAGETLEQSNEPPKDVYIIADERENKAANLPLSYLEQATKLIKAWDFDPNILSIEKFKLNDETSQITISTNQGYRIIFSTEEEYGNQLQRLKEILQQNILPGDVQYIDLRFENSVYFK